jgi:hypothetical protein
MAPAYRETKKGIVLNNGNRLNYGQLFPRKDTNDMASPYQRSLNSSSPLHPRNGSPKVTTEAQPVPGMRSRTARSHDYLHGAPLDDEREPPLKTYEQKIPLHPSTPARVAAAVGPSNDPAAILTEASRLGRPPEKA